MKHRYFWLSAGASALILAGAGTVSAQTCSTTAYPYPLANGQVADATQVTADLTCAPIYGLANASGNVGIATGTTTPPVTFEVYGTTWLNNASGDTGGRAQGLTVSYSAPGNYVNGADPGDGLRNTSFISAGSATAPVVIAMRNVGSNPFWDIVMDPKDSSSLKFSRAGYAPTLTLSGGNVGIGTTAPGQQLTVGGGGGLSITAQSGAQYLLMGNQDSAGVNQPAVIWAANGEFFFGHGSSWQGVGGTITNTLYLTRTGLVGIDTISPQATLDVNGTIRAQSLTQTSDARLKRDVRPLTGALALVAKMQGVRYNWKPVAERTVGKDLNLPLDEPQVGFLAQDLEKVLPEAVKAPKPGTTDTYSVEETKVVPVLVEAIKEQQAQIKELREEIAKLRATKQ